MSTNGYSYHFIVEVLFLIYSFFHSKLSFFLLTKKWNRCLKFLDKKNNINEQEIDSFEKNAKKYADIVFHQSWDDSVYEHYMWRHLPKISR